MKLVVHIDRLVLDGLAAGAGEPQRLREALEGELARLLRDAGTLPARTGAVPLVRAPAARLAPGATPEAAGALVARAVHRGLGGGS
jgi:hypothetical protein